MMRKLIIDGNAVFEVDENCMLRRQLSPEELQEMEKQGQKKEPEQKVEKAKSKKND